MRTRHNCPLCSWYHVEPEVEAAIDENTLAGAYGIGFISEGALAERAQRVERALEAHFASHGALDWIRKYNELERRAAEADARSNKYLDAILSAAERQAGCGPMNVEGG